MLRGLFSAHQVSGKVSTSPDGEVFDVAAICSSPTFRMGWGISLRKQQTALDPAGLAHGFYVVSQTADLAYMD